MTVMEASPTSPTPMRPGRNGGMLRIGGTNKGGPGRPRKHPRQTPETPSTITENPVPDASLLTNVNVADADAELFEALDDLIDRFVPGASGPIPPLRDRVRAALDAMDQKEGAAALARYVAYYLTPEKQAEGFGIRAVCKTVDVLRHCVKTPLLPRPPKV